MTLAQTVVAVAAELVQLKQSLLDYQLQGRPPHDVHVETPDRLAQVLLDAAKPDLARRQEIASEMQKGWP